MQMASGDNCKNSSNGLACCKMLEEALGLKPERKLGEGGQGLVLLCHQAATGRRFACKVIASHRAHQLQQTSSSSLPIHILQMSPQEAAQNDGLRWEAEVMERLRGLPYILPISAKAESDDGCMHIFTPVCDGGDLHARLAHSAGGVFPEREAAYVVARLARALLSCHRQGIVHLDLKPANVLFRSRMFDISTLPNSLTGDEAKAVHDKFVRQKQQQPASSYHVFLADFGHAANLEYIEPGLPTYWRRRRRPRETLHDPNVGTLPFNAPEVIRKCYDHRADIWSLGLILHFMLTAQLPSFLHRLPKDASDTAIRRAILSFDITDQQQLNNMQDDALLQYGVSPSAQSLLRGMLCKDPASRITLQQLLKHPWVTGNINQELHSTSTVLAPIKPAGRAPVPAAAAAILTGHNNCINTNIADVAAVPRPPVPYSRPRKYKPGCTTVPIDGNMAIKADDDVDLHVGINIPAPAAVVTSTLEASDSCRIISAAEFMQGISTSSSSKKGTRKKRKLNMDDQDQEGLLPVRLTREVQKAAAGGFSCFQQQHDVWRTAVTNTAARGPSPCLCL